MTDPCGQSGFTPGELAQLRTDDARADRANPTKPVRVVYRDRVACPRCSGFRFRIHTTKTSKSAVQTRYCTCMACRWQWKIIDIPGL